MTRLIPHGDMTANEILDCSYEAQAIIETCALGLENLDEGNASRMAGNLALALKSALTLLEPVHDALESHEGMAGKS